MGSPIADFFIVIGRAISLGVSWTLIAAVRLYQIFLSPFLGRNCRFTPSCSAYFIGAVKKHGPLKGSMKGVWRICRCNPYNPGGEDPP